MKLDYFYGGQTERVMKHLIRMFSNFSIQDGYDTQGNPQYRRVPCRAGDISRQAAVIINENSENKMPSAPFITVSFTNFNLKTDQTAAPASDQTVVGINKKQSNGQYSNDLEGYYEVERYNPVAWEVEFAVDIWTTSQTTKWELFEQIATVFNKTVPFQLSTNPLDQTSFSYIEMKGYNHTSRSFPQGSDYNLDISQFQFTTTMYLSLPAKVNRAKLINQIVTDINVPGIDEMNLPTLSNWETISTDVFSPGNHMVELVPTNNVNVYNLKLLTKYGVDNMNGQPLSWENLLEYYNPAMDETVEITLLDQIEGDQSEIIGNFQLTTDDSTGILTIDPMTMPEFTLTFSKYISLQKTLQQNTQGNLIVHESSEPVMISTWYNNNTDFLVEPNMILEYDGTNYVGRMPEHGEVVQSLEGRRYKYLKEIGWHEVVKTRYNVGFWRISFRPL